MIYASYCEIRPLPVLQLVIQVSHFACNKDYLGGGFNYFLFSPLPGETIQFDEHIFQMG